MRCLGWVGVGVDVGVEDEDEDAVIELVGMRELTIAVTTTRPTPRKRTTKAPRKQ
jgi:NifB/MoaA-like Fe-S oxidoreductase